MPRDRDPFLEAARRELDPKMRSSTFVVTVNPAGPIDPKIAIETGYAVLLDKPIILVVAPGLTVNAGLRRIAREVVELTSPLDSMGGQAQLQAALERLGRRLDPDGMPGWPPDDHDGAA